MKIRIERNKNTFEQMILDTKTNEKIFFKVSKENEPNLKFPFKGYYDILDNNIAILFKKDIELALIINDQSFAINSDFSIQYNCDGHFGFLSAKNNDATIVAKYRITELIPVSTYDYSEEEDVNFGLWLANVLNSNERTKIY